MYQQVDGLQVEYQGVELVPKWDAGILVDGLTYFTTVLASCSAAPDVRRKMCELGRESTIRTGGKSS